VNPPRTGLHERVSALLQASATPALVYVSCNPATLSRDLARLPAYRVASVRSFDMFPQTAHVETVCELVREAA
jgi:tRNA/tmRNA/rRNA uracil-C5-methylase (TrmA/RlmC/RlmD family)